MDFLEIHDLETFKDWMKGRSRDDAICIAYRIALRIAPLSWTQFPNYVKSARDVTALHIIRPITVCGVARKYPSAEVEAVAKAIVDDGKAGAAPVFAANTVYGAPQAAFGSTPSSATIFAADYAAYHLLETAKHAVTPFWESVRIDCESIDRGEDPIDTILWYADVPVEISDMWAQTRIYWADMGGPVWAFWINWYENALEGRPQDWPLLRDIALIPSEDWEGGPDRVHPIIERMLLEGAVKATANAERISINPETGRLRVETLSELPGKHLRNALDRLADASRIFDEAVGGNNSYALIRPEVDLLRDGLGRYADRPNMLVVTCKRVVLRVGVKIESGDCPAKDALVEDFLSELNGVASDLLIFDPEVKEAASARALSRLKDITPEGAQLIEVAAHEVAAISEGTLAQELPTDAKATTDQTLTEGERKDALFQTASRLFRVENIKRGYKAARAGVKETADVAKDAAIIGTTIVGLPSAVTYLLSLLW